MTSFQTQAAIALDRIVFFTKLMNHEGEVKATEATADLVDYYNDHTNAECETKLIKLKVELAEIHRDSVVTSPFASPTQISIKLKGINTSAFLIRANNPRLVLCQDRILHILDNGTITKEIDLLSLFSESSNEGSNVL
jgi:hypothetical protein